MCGIAGIYHFDAKSLPPETREQVHSMTESLVHRGPDGSGILQDGPVCLGHRRLSIIDVDGGRQPMQSWDQAYAITYNGELYNFAELRKELEEQGAIFRTRSDTEVVLESYRRWGVAALDRFEGMFAFALWDRSSRKLLLARDRFGKKPLFYTIQHGACFFASELSALAALKELSFTLDPGAIIRYLAYEYVPAPNTMYREAKILLPAHYTFASPAGMPQIRYWDLPSPMPENTHLDQQELCLELRGLLRAAVRRRMISDVPLGVFLSGGLDSSLVTALMAEVSTQPVKTFSIGFQEASYDESRYARIIVNHFQTDHTETILAADTCAHILPKLIAAMDVPMADASLAPTYLLAQSTRKHVTVALGGDGSDELWAGYENYAAYALGAWYQGLPSFVRKGILEPLAKLFPEQSGYINLHRALATFFHASYCPNWLRIQDLLTAIHVDESPQLFHPSFAAENAPLLARDVLFAATRTEYEHWQAQDISPLARAFHVYIRHYLPEDILVKVDRASMLNSLEVRAPFLDRKLAEFTARLPLSYKCAVLKGKKLLLEAATPLLPARILRRNKRGFQIPVADWLRGQLRPLLEDSLNPKRLEAQGILNPAAIQPLVNAHVSGSRDLRKELWTLLVLQLWLNAQKRLPAVHM